MQETEKSRLNEKDKKWYVALKNFLKIFVRKPKFIFLGKEITDEPSIILSNHVGSSGPIVWQLYFQRKFKFWGTYEMTKGLKSVYKYLSEIYFYKKRHLKRFWAKVVAFITAPFMNLFYKGMQLIPTYRDARFKQTLKDSVSKINKGTHIVIFPEDSSNGYFDEPTKFFGGFSLLGDVCLKSGLDMPVYIAYYSKKDNAIIIDKPKRYSELKATYHDRKTLAEVLRVRMNEIFYKKGALIKEVIE